VLPLLAATGGAGAALGALVVGPITAAAGPGGVLLVAGGVLALASAGAGRLTATRRVAAPRRLGALITRSWRDGARAVRRHPLAQQLAIVVAVAGVFASLVYVALGVAVAATGGKVVEYAEVLGTVRGAGQGLTLVVQLLITARLINRLGTGRTLLLAPLVALAAGLGLVIAPILAVAIAAQVSARVLDAGIETPAEKIAQTLLPTVVRGRIGGFLDGPAKRAGAVVGGLAATALIDLPSAFYAATAIAGAVWLVSAGRLARALPALAIEHVAGEARGRADELDAVDDRAIAALGRELEGERPERAAEVLARLHDRGRIDALAPLARAAAARGTPPVWRALVAVLASSQGGEPHGPALLEAARAATTRAREHAVRALGLAGGVPPDAVEQWRAADPASDPIALTAEIARRRLAGDRDATLALIADAARERSPAERVAVDELALELARGPSAHALEAARHLARAVRRGRGDPASRAHGLAALARIVAATREQKSAELSLLRADLLELARERVEQGASKPAPETALVSLLRTPGAAASGDDAAEVAAALRLYGAMLEGQGAVDADDLRRLARALGEPDDDVRAAAEDVLSALGPAAAGELIATAAYGRRRARDRAAALLADLPVTAATIDRLVDAELDELERTAAALAALGGPDDELVARRLDERLREIAHTVLLLVAARGRSRAIARAAVAWRHARGGHERARTLAVIETALPRPLVGRLVDAVDDLSPRDRAAALVRAGQPPPARDAVIRDELAGRDRLARALVLYAIGAAGRSAHRDTIARAAHAEALAASATDLLRRLTEAIDDPVDEGADMPSRVETLIALGRVPLLAALSTRQLADVAERARWSSAARDAVVITAGDPIDALIVVEDGELQLGDRRIGKGEVVDELACVAPVAAGHDLIAAQACRLIRLERVDFEELVDDVPGLASAVCRALGERARRAEDASYRSPTITRA